MDMLFRALRAGKLCVVDVSQLRGSQSLVLSGLILRRIFDHNQQEFTAAEPSTIPTIAVVEEAQSVLNDKASAAEPYIAWVKEGRKYDLGAMLVTQQPGSIPTEILSQGDNWFIFHLLSSADLTSVRKANAHFSDDLLSSLLNEPIPGQGVFWSSVGGTPYPISIRALSFERIYQMLDPNYNQAAANTYARQLREDFQQQLEEAVRNRPPQQENIEINDLEGEPLEENNIDAVEVFEAMAINALQNHEETMQKINSETGIAWGGVKAILKDNLPDSLDNLDNLAYQLVPKALNFIFGKQNVGWYSYRNNQGKMYVKTGPKPND